MDDLAALAMHAHGGLARWRQRALLTAHQSIAGLLCDRKARCGPFNDTTLTCALHRQWVSQVPFAGPALRAALEPRHAAIESLSAQVLAERRTPRRSFAGHGRDTPWDTLQMAYFTGYAGWLAVTAPFNFALPGVHCREIAAWDEYGKRWRRLRVRFPPSIASHCRDQVFYFDRDGLVRRHDCNIDIAGRWPAADYVAQHAQVAGIVVASGRLMLARLPDNAALPEPAILAVELDRIVFT
jgi:hypothetical protein